MPSLVFLEADPEDHPRIRARFPDAVIVPAALEGDALVAACGDAAIVSCFIYSPFTAAVIDRLPRLRLLCTRSVGWNHIDLDACARRSITVCNVPDYGSHVIAEHVFALLLSTLRHIPEADARVERGEFDYRGLRGAALQGKTIGIVGTGKIGRVVARIAHGFGMTILAVDKCRTQALETQFGVRYVELPEQLAASHIVTLHVPATPETTHMLDAAAFASMRDGVILVNTARGDLIDSAALLQALQSGKVGHALLDVLEHERNFAENQALIAHPNVVTTPHIAFYAEESMRNMYEDAFGSIDAFLRGESPAHTVQPVQVVCDRKGVR